VKKIVSGKVTKIGETQWLLAAQIVDVETAETLRAESLRYRGDYFSMLDEGIVTLVSKLSTSVGAKPDMPAFLAAQQQAQPKAAPKPEEPKPEEGGSSSSKWWWILGGVVLLAAAAAGGSSSKSSSSPPATGTTPTPSSSTTGSLGISW